MTLSTTPIAQITIDRGDRDDIDRSGPDWADAAVLRIDPHGHVAAIDGHLQFSATAGLGDSAPPNAVYLGRLADSRPVWAIRAALEAPTGIEDNNAQILGLRSGASSFEDASADLLRTATAVLNWHEAAQYSPTDGSLTTPARGGWSRINPATGAEDFPRIDPAVICLIHDGADQVVLARQAVWQPRLFALLAGFVEAGESFESCLAREISEEIGIAVHDITYSGSQSWPFPRSLMVGFHAIADPAQPFSLNDGEIAQARWFTRAEIRSALDMEDWDSAAAARSPLLLPGAESIARDLLTAWAFHS